MGWQPENCDRCNEPLDESNTFYVHIVGGPPPNAVCSDCHRGFVQLMEDLFSSKKVADRSDRERIMKVRTEWFDASVAKR